MYEEVQCNKDDVSIINRYTQCEAYAMIPTTNLQPVVIRNGYENSNPEHSSGQNEFYHFSKCSAYGNQQNL